MSLRGAVPCSPLRDGGIHLNHLDDRYVSLAENLAFEHGECYDSYLLLDEGREYFFSSDRRGVVGFSRWRGHAYVLGGLLTAAHNKGRLLDEFLAFAKSEGLKPLFFGLLATDLPLFQERDLSISKIGEEPIIDLQQTTWRGRSFEWVRRQENSCLRSGVAVREVEPRPACPAYRDHLASALREVSAAHLGETVYGRELSLMVGRFDPLNMHRKRLFIAECAGRVEGFVVLTPAYGGRYWGVETYRRRPDARSGIVPCLIKQVAEQLREEGVGFLSLCQVPGLRCDRTQFADSLLVRNSLSLWWTHFGWFYDPTRLYHFKSRFRPCYREMYLAGAQPRFVPMLVLGLKWGIVWPDFRRLPKQMLRRMRKWSHRERLADPNEEHAVIIDRLFDDKPKLQSVLAAEAKCPSTPSLYELSQASSG